MLSKAKHMLKVVKIVRGTSFAHLKETAYCPLSFTHHNAECPRFALVFWKARAAPLEEPSGMKSSAWGRPAGEPAAGTRPGLRLPGSFSSEARFVASATSQPCRSFA